MLELILIRHGETASNTRNTYLGRTDVPLNDKGLMDAQGAADLLKNEKLDYIYSSPLQRAVQTAKAVNQYHKKEIVLCENLRERDFGIWDDLTYDEIRCQYPEHHDIWVKDWVNYVIPEGESAIETFERTKIALKEIIEKHPEGKVAFVTHLGIIRNAVAYLLGFGIHETWRFRVFNGSVSRIQINDDGFGILISLNNI